MFCDLSLSIKSNTADKCYAFFIFEMYVIALTEVADELVPGQGWLTLFQSLAEFQFEKLSVFDGIYSGLWSTLVEESEGLGDVQFAGLVGEVSE